MENFDEYIDVLIARHLAGETAPDEDVELQGWVAQSPQNQRYFADLQAIWQRSMSAKPTASRPVDTEAALLKVKTRVGADGHFRVSPIRLGYWWRAAAAVALLLTAVYFLWLRTHPAPATVIAATDAHLIETLSDGSVITLAPRSGLTVIKGFNTRERRLRMHGEAYFEVKSDTTRPFVVEIQTLEVRVVGTAFKVDEASNPGQVIVAVAEGKVRVSTREQSLLLQAGESAVYEKQRDILSRLSASQNPLMENRMLQFDATSLGDVVRQVEILYDIKVTLKNKNLEHCVLTARYNNLPPERVLDLIAESFSLRLIKVDNGAYILDGAGCGE